jgi:ELWxxDGT repeat protein
LRVAFNSNAPGGTNADANYNLIVNPAVAPPVLAADITPGTESANITASVRMGTSTYFLTSDGENAGLWKTDGTTAGTVLVKAGAPGNEMIVNGSTLYFAFEGDDKGVELWKTDGTTAGTVRVSDINTQNTGQDGSNPSELTVFNGKIYFSANNGLTGNEVWQSDGTAAGTTIVANINTQTVNGVQQGSDPSGFVLFNGHLIISGNDGVNGREVWRISTTNVATIVANQTGSANPQEFVVAGSNLYYSAATGGQDANGLDRDVELIRLATNWTGAKLDINSGTASSTPTDLFVWGTDVYLAATSSQGRELFRANATTIGQIADIWTGTTGANQNSSNPSGYAVINGRLVFAATDGTNGRELWAYPGSGAPVRISQIAAGSVSSSPVGMVAIQGAIWFAASAGSDNYELYRTTDGINVLLVREINTGNSNLDPSVPYGFVDGGTGKVIFSAFSNANGFEPWISDGTNAGTVLLKDTNTLPREGIGEGVTLNGWTYFAATDQNAGRELYRTNGTITQLVSDIVPGVGSSNPSNLTVAGGFVYFSATTEANGTKLYRTDGTTTTIVGHINATNVSDNVGNVVADSSGNLFFTANNADGSLSLRRVNGASLTEVKNFGINGFVAEMTALGNAVYLSASDRSGSSDIGLEPWRVTTAGATLMGDINPGTGKSSNPYEFVRTDNGDIYFAANNDASGYELYRSVGGTATPTLVKEIGAGANGSNLTSLKALGNEVFFAAYDGSLLKIYRTDGTSAGTVADNYLNLNSQVYDPLYGSDKPDLKYEDYLQLMPVSSASGSSIYGVHQYGQRDTIATTSNGLCGQLAPDTQGREISVAYSAGINPHAGATRPTSVGTVTSTPGGAESLSKAQSALSVDYRTTCNASSTTYEPYRHATYDARLAGHEDVVLGNVNGIIYLAGWKSNRHEVWSMAHSESLTTRYTADGGVAPRNLNFVGSFSNIERGTLEFQPSGTQMLMKGYDKVAAKQRAWKL